MLKINDKERKVLVVLAEAYSLYDWGAYGFKGLAEQTDLEIKEVRRACRSLAKKGLSKFEQVLWNDDGPAGAGYRATEEGAALINPCDVCGARATYDYEVDENGEFNITSMDKATRIQECEKHYKQSPKLQQALL